MILTGITEDKIFNILILPFVLFAALNLVCYFIDWQPPIKVDTPTELHESVLLSKLGISIARVKFPLAAGVNSFATVVGGVFTILLSYFFFLKKRGIKILLSIFVIFVTVILTDSRSGLLYPIIITGGLFLLKRFKNISIVRLLPFIIIVGPILMITLLPMLAESDLFSGISRSGEDISTGNARFLIWTKAFSTFLNFNATQIYGYGVFGHYASGASRLWESVFDSPLVHPHNSALSVTFDYGYIGLVVLISVLLYLANIFKKRWAADDKINIIFFSFFIYFCLISISETFFGFYYLNSIYLIIMMLIVPFFEYEKFSLKAYVTVLATPTSAAALEED